MVWVMNTVTEVELEMKPDQNLAYMDRRQYASHLNFSVPTLDRLLKKGLPHLKISARKVRINVLQADRWMHAKFNCQRR